MKSPFPVVAGGLLGLTAALVSSLSAGAMVRLAPSVAGLQVVSGHLRPEIGRAPLVGVLPPSQTLHLTIGLPLRNRIESRALVAALSDPASPHYRRYLTPAQFQSEFSPSIRDYEAVLAYARASHFTVTRTYANRVAIAVAATVATIQQAFHLTIQTHLRSDGSVFYAPSNEPALAVSTPILHISGLDNQHLPKPLISTRSAKRARGPVPDPGSGPGGTFAGPDFRSAYAPGTARTGVNQCVGLLEFNSTFFPSDITSYEADFGLPPLVPQQVLLDGFNGIPVVSPGEQETAMDIEAALAMAPGLSNIWVYEGSNPDDIFAAMASPTFSGGMLCNQLSASWTFTVDSTSQQLVDQMALQGQSLYVASGDSGGYTSDPGDDRDLSNLAVVGGTELTLDPNRRWTSEVAWPGSGGGLETSEYTPTFQHNLKIANPGGGGTTLKSRGVPDIAMVAANVFLLADNGNAYVASGTSISTPLWAAETALINEQAQIVGQGPLGFPDPALYTIGRNPPLYAANFHDITSGNNGLFNAVPAYDLVTGWGSPTVQLIATLNPAPTANFTQLQFVVYTGSDNLRPDSDLQVSFTGIANLAPVCLMRSNNGKPSGICTGNAYGDVNGLQGWSAWSTQTLTYTNRFANWKWKGNGTMTLTLTSHNNGLETNDNWDIQAMSVTLSNPNTSKSVTLFNVGDFNAPHVSGTCYWRFKPTGSPPSVKQAFNLLPGTTPSNGCPNDN